MFMFLPPLPSQQGFYLIVERSGDFYSSFASDHYHYCHYTKRISGVSNFGLKPSFKLNSNRTQSEHWFKTGLLVQIKLWFKTIV